MCQIMAKTSSSFIGQWQGGTNATHKVDCAVTNWHWDAEHNIIQHRQSLPFKTLTAAFLAN